MLGIVSKSFVELFYLTSFLRPVQRAFVHWNLDSLNHKLFLLNTAMLMQDKQKDELCSVHVSKSNFLFQ